MTIMLIIYHLTLAYCQHLSKVQSSYGLEPVAETDLDVEVRNFNPQESHVTVTVSKAETESAEWLPEYQNEFWIQDKKMFRKVSSS